MILALYISMSLLVLAMFVIAKLWDRLVLQEKLHVEWRNDWMNTSREMLEEQDKELDRLKAKVQFEDESG